MPRDKIRQRREGHVMPATTADLTGYTKAARRAIESEAYVWLYGDQEGARRMYDKKREWVRALNANRRHFHKCGSWYSNDLLLVAAICEVEATAPKVCAYSEAHAEEGRPAVGEHAGAFPIPVCAECEFKLEAYEQHLANIRA